MFKIVDELKRANGKRREELLRRMHAKNLRYFQRTNPEIASFIELRGTGRFAIRTTDEGIEVSDRSTGQLYHPPGQLIRYSEELGHWHHTAWVDKLMIIHVWRGDGFHGASVKSFLEGLYSEMPQFLAARMGERIARLPLLADGRRYSGPVVFLGVFTGLHIMFYLNRTVTNKVYLVEPDLDRFVLSCFFFDYEQLDIDQQGLLLHVGPNAPQRSVDLLIGQAPTTASAWVRLLPAYPDGQFDDIISLMALRHRAFAEVYVPAERELNNLVHGLRNIQSGLPFLARRPALSSDSVITIVASGPSLKEHLPWLRDNQSKMIIVASISCARVLAENGIRPDFYGTLDTEIDDDLFTRLQLDTTIPLIAYYKLNPELVKRFDRVLLVHEDGKANSVRFHHAFTWTHPTTGNLMTAVAAWCRPACLMFIGLDLGFRDPKRSHVEGGWHDDNAGSGHAEETGEREALPVNANFPESEGQILTIAYYNNARASVEGAVTSIKECQVYNLSDGARISGAQPKHFFDLDLGSYTAKGKDLDAIVVSFTVEREGIMEPYGILGKELIGEAQADMRRAFEIEGGFNWLAFSRAMDSAWGQVIQDTIKRHREMRLEVFGKLVFDLLAEWYRTLILAETPDRVETLYRRGLDELDKAMRALPWPAELDVGGNLWHVQISSEAGASDTGTSLRGFDNEAA